MSAAERVQTAQKLTILQEASPSEPVGVLDLGEASDDAGSILRRSFAALGAGSLSGDTMQVFALRTPRGTPHVYVQPFDGRHPVPGEHHIVLPMPCPAPAAFLDGTFSSDWKSSDPAFEAALRKHPCTRVIDRASWDWKLGAGRVRREWLAQLRPTADGRTHLVMQGTGEASVALDTRPVGFATFTALVLALMQQPIAAAAAPAAVDFARPAAYTALFGALIAPGAPAPALPRADLRGRELGPAIHQLLAGHARGKLHVHPVPPKKDASARAKVMPPAARQQPIVALLDLTLLGSASDAIVMTPTHVFFRDGDAQIGFEWSEVRAVGPMQEHDDVVRVQLAERGWIALPCGDHAAALGALFHELAAIPAATS